MKRPLRSDTARALANLAIDLGDPGRMAKARRLYRSSAAATLDIDGGIAYASIADDEGTHEVEVRVLEPLADDQIPEPSDLSLTCTCDDTADVCRHGLATILALAEEVEIDVRTLSRWAAFEPHALDAADEIETTSSDDDFFLGAWRNDLPEPRLIPLLPREATLVVDEVDAGPIAVDATRAIMKKLGGR